MMHESSRLKASSIPKWKKAASFRFGTSRSINDLIVDLLIQAENKTDAVVVLATKGKSKLPAYSMMRGIDLDKLRTNITSDSRNVSLPQRLDLKEEWIMYRYRITDSDGDKSVVEFDFDRTLGRLLIEPGEINHLVTISTFRRVPTADELISLFEETGADVEEATNRMATRIKSETLLALLRPEWCESNVHLHDISSIFDACQKMCLQVTMINAVIKHGDGDNIEIPNHLPELRFYNLSFLWDAFVYYESNKDNIISELGDKLEEIKIELGDSAQAVLPWDLEYWILPVKIYDDIDNIVTRIPYKVMRDIYDDVIVNNTPVNVTDEIKKLLEDRKNRNN
jgi:hypothetical protein